MLQKSNSRSGRVSALIGLGLISNLTLSIGLLPWFTLSAQGQAVLLETNPAPQTPSFEIPTEVAPAPTAPVTPEVAYDPAPYVEPAPEPYIEPEPYVAPEPEPYFVPEPAPYVAPAPVVAEPEVFYEPEPVVEVAPTPPAPIAQPAPDYFPPAPPQGCAALLDLAAPQTTGCGSPANVEVAPPMPQPASPTVIANENPAAPIQANIPPARRVQVDTATPALAPTPAIPPARQLTAVAPVVPPFSPAPAPSPSQLTPVPTYRNLSASVAPVVSPTPSTDHGIVTATLPEIPPSQTPSFTAVKPDRYSLKPLNSRNPLEWILGNQTMLFPLPFPIPVSSAFGWRQHPIQQSWHLHSGIDFAAPQGTPVVAAYDGQVAIADHVGGYGLSVLLNHNQGERQTRYAHLSQIFVRPGQTVSQGDVLGSVGSTGNSTGPHLHFETLVKTPEGMVVADPTEEVKTALINTLTRMQTIAQQERQPEDTNLSQTPQDIAKNQPPIPVEVIQPMSRYQAHANLSVPILTE